MLDRQIFEDRDTRDGSAGDVILVLSLRKLKRDVSWLGIKELPEIGIGGCPLQVVGRIIDIHDNERREGSSTNPATSTQRGPIV